MCNIVDPHSVATITILEWVLKGNGMLVCYKQCVSRRNVLPHSLNVYITIGQAIICLTLA